MAYICVCQGITTKQLKDAASQFLRIEDFQEVSQLGMECGCCLETAMKEFEEFKSSSTQSS